MAEEAERHPNNPNIPVAELHDFLLRIWDLSRQGYTQKRIAKEMNRSEAVISKRMKEARELFTPLDLKTEAQLWLARWDEQYQIAMDEIREGNNVPQMLAVLRNLQNDRAKFLGTAAAKKVDINWHEQDDIDVELEEMLNEVKMRQARKRKEVNGDG